MWNRKYDLIGAAVFAIMLLLILMFAPRAVANETNQTKQLNDWFEKQYIEFITYQKEQWQQGLIQLSLNKEQVVNLPENISLTVSETITDVSSYFNSLLRKTND